MKKIYSVLLAALAFIAASCQVEIIEVVETPEKEVMKITAGFNTDTKTVLVDGTKIYWQADDQVSVFDARTENNNRLFTIEVEEGETFPEEGAPTATFVTEEEFQMPGDQTQEQALIVALYPYQENAFCNFMNPGEGPNLITGIEIPAAQTAVANGFDESATFALATDKYTNKDKVSFKNLYSLLKVTLAEEGVHTIKVVFESANNIVGPAQVVLNRELVNNEPVFNGGILEALETGSKEVTLSFATNEKTFEVGVPYGIAIAPVTYTNIKVYLDDELVKDTNVEGGKQLLPGYFYNITNLKKPASRGLSFPETSYTATLGSTFTAPDLNGEAEGVVYSSSNEAVATVNATTGVITLVAAGETTITATAPKTTALQAATASYTLTVNPAPKVERGLAFNPTSVTLTYGETFTAPVLSGVADGVKYTSSEPTVATVTSEGVVEILKAGTTTITASAEETETLLAGEATYTLTVNKADRTISFAQSSVEVTYGDPFTGQTLADVTGVTYEVTGDAATVNPATGAVTIVKAGTVTIKATVAETDTHNAATAEYTLTVNKAERTLSFNKTVINVNFGEGFSDFSKPTLSGDVEGVTYSSNNTIVATVDSNGDVEFKSTGDVTITATLKETLTHLGTTATYKIKATRKVRIYVQVWPHNDKWDNWKQTPKIHYWGDYGESSWPGNLMTLESGSKFYYEFDYSDSKKTKFLINNGTGNEKSGDSEELLMNKNYSYQVYTEWNNNYEYLTLHKD